MFISRRNVLVGATALATVASIGKTIEAKILAKSDSYFAKLAEFYEGYRHGIKKHLVYTDAKHTWRTKKFFLDSGFTFESAYDGCHPYVEEFGEFAFGEHLASYHVIDLNEEIKNKFGKIDLVSLDTMPVKIDQNTFEPIVPFYIEINT